jgi:transcriptional regulator with XRE-family HTH domain
MHPGERIKDFRKKKGITQKDFAERMDYSYGYLATIELGRVEPSREFLKKLNEVFGVSSDYILYGNPPDQTEIGLAKHPEEYIKEEKKAIFIREPESKFQILSTATKKLLNNVIEILESGNEEMIDALKANIKAFLGATRVAREKRQYPRFLLNLPVDVQIIDGLEIHSGVAVNASQMGLLIESTHDLPIEKTINLKIAFQKNAGPEDFRAKAEIMWKDKRRLDDIEKFHYGVKLIEVLNEGHAKLESLLQD